MQKIEIDLSALFKRFVGQPVVLEQETVPITGTRIYTAPFEKNPVLAEMEQLAAEEGLRFKVWTPQTPGKKEFYANRVNITLKQNKDNDNRWEISGASNDSGSAKMLLFPKDLSPKREKTEPASPATPEAEQQSIRVMKPLRLKKLAR